MTLTLGVVVAVVVVALAFAFTNGFHDAATAVATSISTRALTPGIALTLAAMMNFVGALLGHQVARTVTGVISPPTGHTGLVVVLGALIGAMAWNLSTWWWGLPSSSTHALIGGLAGAALAGGARVHWSLIVRRVLVPMLVSPLIGLAAAFALMLTFLWVLHHRNPHRVQRGFRMVQVFSAAALALGHGLQDAQKTMGVILLALLTAYPARYAGTDLPLWVIVAAAAAISLGTFSGGWRIMRTVARRIVTLDPARGFTAEAVGATVLYVTAFLFKAPVSTTQVFTSAVVGAGATGRLSAVRWDTARRIGFAWLLTFPAAALVGYLACLLLRLVLPG